MSKFKLGDRVICVKSSDFYMKEEPAHKGFKGVVAGIGSYSFKFKGDSFLWSDSRFELIQDKRGKEMRDTEKKYKIETGLSLQQVKDLSNKLVFTTAFVELHNELHDIYRKAQRKVVKVGDKEYYEDELATALANIKPIK